jgi:ABC-2 type transport system ATP-binding protein
VAGTVRGDGVWKRFRLYHERHQTLKESLVRRKRGVYEELWALRDVSFEIAAGQTVAIIGENGSGKSTLLKCIARILRPDKGAITVDGRLGALLELGAGFHPELTGRENVFLNGSILGFGRKEIARRFDEIVGFADLERFIDMQVKNYSSGMYVRLGFAIATLLEPEVLLVDEILAVGDEAFQRRSGDKFYELRRRGTTIVVVSHAISQLRTLCDRALFLHRGDLMADGPAGEVIDQYLETVQPDRGEKHAAPGGGGTVEITAVETLDVEGAPVEAIKNGDPMTVRIRYRCTDPVEHPVFEVGLWRQDGVLIGGSYSKLHGFDLGTVAGDGVVEYRLQDVPLVAGRYWVSAAILDWSQVHVFHRIERARSIDVRSSIEWVGMTQFNASWHAGTPADTKTPAR